MVVIPNISYFFFKLPVKEHRSLESKQVRWGSTASRDLVRRVPLFQSSLLRLILERFERITKVSEPSCFVRFLRSNILGSGFLEAWAGLRGCCVAKLCPPTDDTVPVPVPVTCILASFDAWLFADSDVLWAFLVSKIFDQVEWTLHVGIFSSFPPQCMSLQEAVV